MKKEAKKLAKEMLKYCDRQLECNPYNIILLTNKAEIYKLIENNKMAVQTCEEILKLDPNNKKADEILFSIKVTQSSSWFIIALSIAILAAIFIPFIRAIYF